MSDDADERAHERVGSVLNDKWTLERLVGIGGMAAVYAGVHRNGARAAIKVLHPALARRKELRQRFLREGYAANRVSHSGVVKVLDDDVIETGPDEGGAFLVMELLEGQSLEDRMERGPPIEERELLAIMAAVLDVLSAAHKAGVVHRDLKPENLFLARDPDNPNAPPKIKILDFGLARVAEAGNKTMAGIAIGTPSYMPPEQAAGRVFEIDARSDLFALGATCFRILAGRTVHPGESALEICALMAKEPAPKLLTVAPSVSPKTAAVIDRALAFRREDRFRDAGAMRRAVEEALEELGGDTIQIDSGMIEVVEKPEEREPPSVEKKGGAGRWIVALLFVAAVGVAAKVAWDRFGQKAQEGAVVDAAAAPTPDAMQATMLDAREEEPVEAASEMVTAEASVDAEAEDAALDAPADVSVDAPADALGDVEIADARSTSISAPDAGHRRRDGGVHHNVHHGHHH